MKHFYQEVDMRSRKAMIHYLSNHFRYYTMNSWNRSTSYACHHETRMDFTVAPKEIFVYPGRSTDDGEDYEDWSLKQLRERVKLVQELDQLADALVEQTVMIAQNYSVVYEEYYLPQARKVLVASA